MLVVAGFVGASVACWPVAALAQTDAPQRQTADMEDRLSQSVEALETILRQRGVARERAAELAAEIERIRKDRAGITAALIAAAKTERKLGADIIALEDQLADLEQQSEAIRASLWERRALLAEVLAALQRMGLNPPPAILVKPDDALASVRSAIVLGAVVPQMRAEASVLVDDLGELAHLTTTMTEERARLSQARLQQAEEQARLTVLVDEKRALEARASEELAAQQQRFSELAAQADSLQQLIMSLEADLQAAREAAEAARAEAERAEREARQARIEAQRAAEESAREQARSRLEAAERAEREARDRLAESRRRAEELAAQQLRISPSRPFADLRGQLARPVAGRTITAFGDDDGLGGTARGETIETSSNAIVTAPADGWVLYAGPFRAYGNLLILDAGDEHHLVLAGMDRIEVSQGQFVVGGEPVGVMGQIRLAGVTAAAAENDNPTLYVEFRKDGKPIDPSPWWERVSAGRT
ncbi:MULTISPECIES: peptidoglycan DD-metalloendopeptidase family protein [unclassified Roseitalea]|uniref:murein hydrolase activator EnvC family protein n=1 Tax=unclassified Roseitalea TaxID=2639107 RepID=UPI00273D47F6|nr:MULTISPECIES: peptidoglycan DD-metalloendopeptidase family protein [unclassified Roseitalea]